MIKFVKQIQQSLCEHVVNYTLALKRDLQGNVHARCLKYGKDLHADCYLNMYEYKPELINGEWMPGSVAGLVMSVNFHYYSDGYKNSLRKLELE